MTPHQVTKIKALNKPLRKLLHSHGNLHERVNSLRIELDEVQKVLDRNPSDSNHPNEEAAYVKAFTEAKLDEERFLKQKAKIKWLDARDSNSAFFHKFIKSRNRSFRIEVIRGEGDTDVTGSLVAETFFSHYQKFLGTNMTCEALNEIKSTMFSIGDDRAPGLDGFTSAFFKKSWDIMGDDICKVSTPFRGRRTLDNILITQELMHNYHRDRDPPRCAFKVDIQKTYDTVDWGFLRNILHCFGFHVTMVKWIMACVSSVSFSLSINDDIHGYFQGRRGLRQGDPISPYLFTLVMEVLTLIIKRRICVSNTFRYHNLCEDLQIVNVCFADDLFIFSRGEVDSARLIMESLEEFQKSSGLVPSIPKSTVYLCNVCNHVKVAILNIMSFAEGELPMKYLGVPLISTRLLNRDCKILVERVTNRIGDWKNKSLSFAGRLQLCRSVLSSMQVFWASILVIPKGIILDIQQQIREFLWCNGELKRGKAKSCVADLVSNRGWAWPQSWLLKAPNLAIIPYPNLVEARPDLPQWRDPNGKYSNFSVKCAWEALRPRAQIWMYIHHFAGMEMVSSSFHDIVSYLLPTAHRRTTKSIIGRLLIAVASYSIWVEHNNRIFKNTRRSPEEIHDSIMVAVRLKLLTFRFKNTTMVNELLTRRKMPKNFRLYV
ncbi:protein LAZ1 [Tanacetum coccineum]